MNSRPIELPGYHHVFTAAGLPAGVSRNRSSASSDGRGRCAEMVRYNPYVLLLALSNTCITLRLVFGSANLNTYVPGGSVVPGNSTGALNVNSVLESTTIDCANAPAAFTDINIAAAPADTRNLLLSL